MAIWTHHDQYGTEPEPEPNPSSRLTLMGVLAVLALAAWLTCH